MRTVNGDMLTPAPGEKWMSYRSLGCQRPGGVCRVKSVFPESRELTVQRFIERRGVWSKKTWRLSFVDVWRVVNS